MKTSFRQQFERLALRLGELDALLADGGVAADMKRYRELGREHAEASGLVELFRRYERRERDLAAASELLAESSGDEAMAGLARDEAAAAGADLERLLRQLQAALLPRDDDDARNVFLEIRAGTGGDESALFAADLARMYLRFCERKRWRTEILSESASDLGGYKELVVRIEGDSVYAFPRPRRRGASTPAPAPSPCCPSPTKPRR
jgi:peptide chain release factor 1